MKKLFILLTMLIVGIGSSWADINWNITTAGLPADSWTAMGDNTPSGVTAIGSQAEGQPFAAYSRTEDITVSANGVVKVFFRFSSGSDRLEIFGIDLLDKDNNVVGSDYHFGYAGGAHNNNIYTINNIPAGTYTLRYIINGTGISNSQGKIRVSNFDVWNIFSSNLTNDNWVAMGSSAPADLPTGTPYSRTQDITISNSELLKVVFTWHTGGHRLNLLGVDLLDANNNVVSSDYHSGYAGSPNSNNQYFLSAVTSGTYKLRFIIHKDNDISNSQGTINVYRISEGPYTIKAYFSDSDDLYFTNNNGTLAFNNSASNGVKDYWILRPSGNSTYPWRFESGRGDRKFLSGKNGLSNTGVYLQINDIESKFNLRGSYSGDAKTTDIVNLGTWSGANSKSGFGAYGTGGCWSSGGNNTSGWTTEYIIDEVTGADIYTVVSNIDAGGVRYTPSYTGIAEQTNGGFYILSSTPSASDFTKISVENYSPCDITVDASTKTITLKYVRQITDATSISSSKVYRLRTDRTAIYAGSTSATVASATSTADASTLSLDEPLNQWAFIVKDNKKYLYNVGAKKFLKTSPYVNFIKGTDYDVSAWGHNFLESYTTHELQLSTYDDIAGRFWLKDVKSGRSRIYNSGNGRSSINGYPYSDGSSNSGNGWIIEEIPGYTFDPTEALAALDNSISYTFSKVNGDTDTKITVSDEERDVVTGSTLSIGFEEGYYSPILKMKDIKVNGTSSSVGTKNISNGDVIEWVYKCPFIVSDEPSAGAFAENTHWHLLDIHSGSHYYLNIPQDFNYTNKIPANTTKRSFTDDFLWCITGNNTDGYRLYNKQAGPTKVMTFTSGTGAFMSNLSGNENASLFTMQHTNLSGASNTTGAPTFQFTGASARPNFDHYSAVASWGNSDKGSEFTFEPIEESIIEDLANNYMPYFVQNIGNVCGLSWDDAFSTSDLAEEYAAVYENPTVDGYNTFVTHLNAAKVRPVENAKYHIISAYPNYLKKQGVRKALYYDTSASIFKWKNYDSSDEVFTFQLRKTGDNWNIYNPSASKYLKDCQGSNNASDDPSTFTFTDLGLAQLNISDGTGTMHTAGHSEGAGPSGTITRWGGGLNSASSWYIAPIVETVSALTPASVAKDAYVYQTFANPYDCQISNGEVYYITTQTKSTAHIEQATNNIVPANTGVVLKATKGATINVRPLSVEYDEKLKTENSLVPGDGSTTVTAGNYMLAYSSTDDMAKFYAIGAAGYVVPANKAYLPAEAVGARSLTLSFDDDPTGINSIENEPSANDNVIYNIVGQKLNKMQKGINIVNGKKVLVK